MNPFTTHVGGSMCLRPRLPLVGMLTVAVLLLGALPAPLKAQNRHDGGGRGFGPGISRGYGVRSSLGYLPRGGYTFNSHYGWNWSGTVVYPNVVYGGPYVNSYVVWPQDYQGIPQNKLPIVIVTKAHGEPAPENAGQPVYDAQGKPVGAILHNADGSPQFVPAGP